MEGEVTRVVAPASKTGEGPARGQGSNPTSSAVRRLSRDVAQERSACSGNTRPQVRFLSSRRRWCGPIELRYRTLTSLELGTSSTHPVCSCRRCEERDTILRRSMVEVRILPAVPMRAEDARLPTSKLGVSRNGDNVPSSTSCPQFTSRSGDQIELQIRSGWVQFPGDVRFVRASARAAVWRDSRWISSGLSTRHFPRARSRATRTPRGVAQSGRALGSGPRGRWFKSTYPDASTRSLREQFSFVTLRPAPGRRWRVIGSTPRRCAVQDCSCIGSSAGRARRKPPSPLLVRQRAAGRWLSICKIEGRWFESNPMHSLSLRVAQEQSARSGTSRPQVRFLPRRPG